MDNVVDLNSKTVKKKHIVKTICYECVHFVHTGDGLTDMWWDHKCGHPATFAEETVDPVTGEKAYAHINDLGDVVFVKDQMQYAKSVNPFGNCQYYKRKRD